MDDRKVRNLVIGSVNLAVVTTEGGFLGCVAAYLTGEPRRSVCCMSEGRDFNPAAQGSDRTDAVREENAMSLVAE